MVFIIFSAISEIIENQETIYEKLEEIEVKINKEKVIK